MPTKECEFHRFNDQNPNVCADCGKTSKQIAAEQNARKAIEVLDLQLVRITDRISIPKDLSDWKEYLLGVRHDDDKITWEVLQPGFPEGRKKIVQTKLNPAIHLLYELPCATYYPGWSTDKLKG